MGQTKKKTNKNSKTPRHHHPKRHLQTKKTKNQNLNNQNLRIRCTKTLPNPPTRHPNHQNHHTIHKRTSSTSHNTRHPPKPHTPNTNNMEQPLPLNKTTTTKPHPKKRNKHPNKHRLYDPRNLRPLPQPLTRKRHAILRFNPHPLPKQTPPPSRKGLQSRLGTNRPNKNSPGLFPHHTTTRSNRCLLRFLKGGKDS